MSRATVVAESPAWRKPETPQPCLPRPMTHPSNCSERRAGEEQAGAFLPAFVLAAAAAASPDGE